VKLRAELWRCEENQLFGRKTRPHRPNPGAGGVKQASGADFHS